MTSGKNVKLFASALLWFCLSSSLWALNLVWGCAFKSSFITGRERESRSLCNTIIPGFEVFKKWHLGIVWRFAAKLREWVIRYYTVFSLLCSYLGFQMLMMMHLKNITQMWKKRNQKLITNRWVSVSSDFLRSSKNSEAFGTRWGQVVPR